MKYINIFFALAFAALLSLFVLCCYGTFKTVEDCDRKAGVLVQTYTGADICISKEYIIK